MTKSKAVVAGAVAMLIAGCGSGGGGDGAGGGGDSPPPPSVSLSGTAATGMALASSPVSVKCADGDGSATTNASGNYSLTISGASLPCIIQVTGEDSNGVTVTLHSVAGAGTGTTAVANVTPLTEMIVAQLTGALPSETFASFSAGTSAPITEAQLTSATTAVLTALKDATGIDLGSIDPFKSQLVAATTAAPTQGNEYDKVLDALNDKVSTEALPLIVNQIASAANTTGGSAPVSLAEVMTAVEGGSLAGCPAAVSGKYRMVDYWGRTLVRQIDFKNMKLKQGDGQPLFDITADSAKPCEFTASGTFNSIQSQIDFAMSPSGAGAYRSQNLTEGRSVIGYIFPVQAHSFSQLVGTWSFLQSGFIPGDPVSHFPGQLSVNADRKVAACDYATPIAANAACVPDTGALLTFADRTDGGFDLSDSGTAVANVYGYRAPNGALTVFGTTNPTGSTDPAVEQTSFVAAKLKPLRVPAVGTHTKYWDLNLTRSNGVNTTAPITADGTTVTAVDASSFTRTRDSDSRVDTLQVNTPLEGMRYRAQGPGAAVIMVPFPGLGMTAIVNAEPSTATLHFYNIAVNRP